MLTQGWIPASITFDPHTAILTDGRVRWMELGGESLPDAFFQQTIRRLRERRPRVAEIETRLSAIEDLAAELPPVSPAGFIFHISRCGSTLISNAIKSSPDTVVVSEPGHITQLLLPRPDSGGAHARERWDTRRRSLIAALFTLFAHYRTGATERLVIKFPSISTLSVKMVRTWFPDVPCLMVVRDPIEVLVPSLEGGMLLDMKQKPERARALLGWDGAEMTTEVFYARALAQYMACMRSVVDDRAKVVDYQELNPARMHDIVNFFGLSYPKDEGALEQLFAVYSKSSVSDPMPFQNDSFYKQHLASDALRSAVNQFALVNYLDLRRAGTL